jgi:Siphovirus Gp157
MKLYELTAELEQLRALAEDCEPGDAVLAMELDRVTTALEEKGAGIGKVLATLEAEADACDPEIKRLTQKRNRLRANAESLRRYVQYHMVVRGINTIKAETFSFALVSCPDRVVVTDEKSVPTEYVRETVSRSVDKRAVLDAYKRHGECVPGTSIERCVRLQIK